MAVPGVLGLRFNAHLLRLQQEVCIFLYLSPCLLALLKLHVYVVQVSRVDCEDPYQVLIFLTWQFAAILRPFNPEMARF